MTAFFLYFTDTNRGRHRSPGGRTYFADTAGGRRWPRKVCTLPTGRRDGAGLLCTLESVRRRPLPRGAVPASTFYRIAWTPGASFSHFRGAQNRHQAASIMSTNIPSARRRSESRPGVGKVRRIIPVLCRQRPVIPRFHTYPTDTEIRTLPTRLGAGSVPCRRDSTFPPYLTDDSNKKVTNNLSKN